MLKDITLGQFFPGDTVIHRADPRLKIVLTGAYIVALFLAKGPVGYLIMFICLISAIWASKIKPKMSSGIGGSLRSPRRGS